MVREHWIAGAPGFPLDDAWIHLRFASNFAAGRGFGINPGEPIAGSTAPLWTLCLAAALAVGIPGLAAAKALGCVAFVATGLLSRRVASALGASDGLALAAGLGAVGLERLVWGALSGMEVPLAASLVATAALLELRGRSLPAAFTLGLATLARPEAGLLVVLHAASAPRLRQALARSALAALVVAPAILFCLATTGRPFPATAAAKAQGGLIGQLEGVDAAWSVAGHRALTNLAEWVALLYHDHPALPALLLIGLFALRRHRLRWLLLALVLHPVASAFAAPFFGPSYQTGRYCSHLLPLALAVSVVGLGVLLARLRHPLLRGSLLAMLLLPLVYNLWPAASHYAWGVQNVNAMQVTLGRWVADNTPPDAVLAVNDIGALSYFGDRRILDLMGLVTPEVLSFRRAGQGGTLRYLLEACPDYLVIFPAWFPRFALRDDLFEPRVGVRLDRIETAGSPVMVVYETRWSRFRESRSECDPRLALGR